MGNCIHFQLSNNLIKSKKKKEFHSEKTISTDSNYPLIFNLKNNNNDKLESNSESNKQILIPEKIDYKTLPKFIPNINYGKVIKVYDGDTITIASYFPNLDNGNGNRLTCSNYLYKFNIRLKGIDCPEIRSQDPDEKEIAILAREFIYKLIHDKIVYLKNIEIEKYGRLLADVYINDHSCSELLLKHKFAVKYDGKRKEKINWLEYHTLG